MKIKDIIGGTKKRKHRNSRKHRIKQQDLHKVSISDLKEATKGREINHIEDLVLFHGSEGAQRAVNILKNLENNKADTTIKWDGSPALVFGRNESGQFVLTDKGGFAAKGYNGKVTSPDDMEQMFLNRKLKDPTPEKKRDRQEFAKNMASLWSTFENATPEDFRGYMFGDLMYTNTPPVQDGKLVIHPNTTKYIVNPKSEIGQKISSSKVGIVVHFKQDLEGQKGKPDFTGFQGGDLLIMPPVSPNVPTQVGSYEKDLAQIEQKISKSGKMDQFLNPPAELKMSDFQNILYAHVNSTVKTGDIPGKNFIKWIEDNPKISNPKKEKIFDWVSQHKNEYSEMWNIFNGISSIKDKIIAHIDDQPSDIEAYTDGQRGGEGYVVGKDVKLVNRSGFSAANFRGNENGK